MTTDDDYFADPFSPIGVDCPACGATKGEKCIDITAKRYRGQPVPRQDEVHQSRINLYKRGDS